MRKVPELRFAGFDGEWEEKEFSENFDTTIPKNSLSRDKLTNQVTRVKNIHYGDIHKIFDNVLQSSNERIPHIINDDLSTHERYFLQNGDIIFTDAAEDNTAGKCVELDIDDGSNIVAGLHTIPARPIKFGKYFYGFYLNSNSFHNKIIPLLEGTKVSSISKSNLNTLSVIVPKVEEQEKIGNLFRKIDDLIEIQEDKVAKLEDFKKSMLQKMFPKKDELVSEFRFDGFDGEWEIKKIKELASVKTGKSDTKDADDNGIYPFYIRSDNPVKSSKYLYDEEAVLTIGDGQIGKVFFYVNGKYDLHQRVYRIFDFTDDIDPKYFYHYFSRFFLRRAMRLSAKGTVDSVRMEMITGMEIKIPQSKEEQIKIRRFFENLDNQIENEEKLLESYKIMKKSLLQKMFV